MKLSRESLGRMGPTKAVDDVYEKLGGIGGIARSTSFPNLKQVQNLSKRMSDSFSIRNAGPVAPDDLVDFVEKACADPNSMLVAKEIGQNPRKAGEVKVKIFCMSGKGSSIY